MVTVFAGLSPSGKNPPPPGCNSLLLSNGAAESFSGITISWAVKQGYLASPGLLTLVVDKRVACAMIRGTPQCRFSGQSAAGCSQPARHQDPEFKVWPEAPLRRPGPDALSHPPWHRPPRPKVEKEHK